jgi:hypothetical protein
MHHEKAIFLDIFYLLAGGWGLEVRGSRLVAVTRVRRWMQQRQTLSCGEVNDGAKANSVE